MLLVISRLVIGLAFFCVALLVALDATLYTKGVQT